MQNGSNTSAQSLRRGQWKEALRACRRALRGITRQRLAGKDFQLVNVPTVQQSLPDHDLLRMFAANKSSLFDVGANIGLTSLIMAQSANADALVYAIEPSESACCMIHDNAALNGLSDRIIICNLLAGGETGRTIPFHGGTTSVRASSVCQHVTAPLTFQKSMITLDDFTAGLDVKPDGVKIDVEGAEGDVIAGMQKLLKECSVEVVVELHAWPGTSVQDNVAAILPTVNKVGYAMYRLKTRQRVESPECFADVPESPHALHGRSRILLIPADSNLPEWVHQADTSDL